MCLFPCRCFVMLTASISAAVADYKLQFTKRFKAFVPEGLQTDHPSIHNDKTTKQSRQLSFSQLNVLRAVCWEKVQYGNMLDLWSDDTSYKMTGVYAYDKWFAVLQCLYFIALYNELLPSLLPGKPWPPFICHPPGQCRSADCLFCKRNHRPRAPAAMFYWDISSFKLMMLHGTL